MPSPSPAGDAVPEPPRRARWVRQLVRVAALAVLIYLAFRLHDLWRDNAVDLSTASVPLLVTAAIVSFAAVVSYGLVWPRILARLGSAPPSRAVGLFLQSQLGKYLPGGMWHYAGRVGLARARGLPTRTTVVSLGIEVGASVAAAALVGLFVLPVVLAAPLAIALLVLLRLSSTGRISTRMLVPLLRVVRRLVPVAGDDIRVAVRALSHTAMLFVPVWLVYGLAFWLTARALFPVPADDVVYFTATFALSWIAGMVVVFAPGGIGVREAVIVALLSPRVGEAEAIVVAATSRVLLTTSGPRRGRRCAGVGPPRRTPRAPEGRLTVSAAPEADFRGPTGNATDKYGSRNPLTRKLLERFLAVIDELVATVSPSSLLDVGCGEGVVTERLARLTRAETTGVDIGDERMWEQWRLREGVGVTFESASAYELPFDDASFDCVCALEVLEHLERPADALAEMARVSRRAVLVSVPREPVWRAVHMLAGRDLRQLGNTPGHINHWSTRDFERLVAGYARIVDVRRPFPWTVVRAEV